MLGCAHAYAADPITKYADALRYLADEILAAYEATAGSEWRWFENALTYDNARLPQALIRAGHVLRDPRYSNAGLER